MSQRSTDRPAGPARRWALRLVGGTAAALLAVTATTSAQWASAAHTGICGAVQEDRVRIEGGGAALTRAVLLQLAAEGRLDLDAPAAQHLPVPGSGADAAGRSGTVRDLLERPGAGGHAAAMAQVVRDVTGRPVAEEIGERVVRRLCLGGTSVTTGPDGGDLLSTPHDVLLLLTALSGAGFPGPLRPGPVLAAGTAPVG